MKKQVNEFSWVGSQKYFIDEIDVQFYDQVILGRFGGNSSAGQYKNEDGCVIWTDKQDKWECVAILDAHHSAESAELVIEQLIRGKEHVQNIADISDQQAFVKIEETFLHLFQEEIFKEKCRKVKGETACLIVFRKDKYLWWLSIGDCILYLFHPELSKLGQYQVNQRQFYEWVGQVNTFDEEIPCYSSGIRELRKGLNRIVLTTDGLVECPNQPYLNPAHTYDELNHQPLQEGIHSFLSTIRNNHIRDSTTIISWDVNVTRDVARPSDDH